MRRKKGELLKKFKDTEDFVQNVGQNKSIIYFKISLCNFLKKFPVLNTFTLSSHYANNSFKTMKSVLSKHPNTLCID